MLIYWISVISIYIFYKKMKKKKTIITSLPFFSYIMQSSKMQKVAGDSRANTSKSAKQFPWCESRPDGRRAIRNHQEAHGRAIKNARKVVDTSIPKYFKTKLMRGKRSGNAYSSGNATMTSGTSDAQKYFDNVQHRVMSLKQNGLGTNYWRPESAPISGRTVMTSINHIQRPLASPVTRAASVCSRSPQKYQPVSQSPTPNDDAVMSQFDRLTYNFTESQLQSFDCFVQLLSSYQLEDMNTITTVALQEASEKRLFANYRS